MKRHIRTILILVIGLGLASIMCAILLIALGRAFDNSNRVKPEPVLLCKEVWSEIEYLAERYELDGMFPAEALEAAVLYAAESVSDTDSDVQFALESLERCLHILDDAGYFDKRF